MAYSFAMELEPVSRHGVFGWSFCWSMGRDRDEVDNAEELGLKAKSSCQNGGTYWRFLAPFGRADVEYIRIRCRAPYLLD